ncbi:hypothetical protein [Streptomyces mobaraensis]|uniref:Uncharacterized protein n=1 Tax=Streptomyces mobaraensis (strain ATCC 29032 / DSM 40847 / JCM 4168 / NBRC 13819 / NCIMB 11159 / IPCR 16-22) TaxID=1223523 RepID=M3AXE9_STRM1|nr:hypothetical protein [Streptomyces mobaraensis]EME98277.1 hypothetical protein H340_22281 [Streptomyces mobaraensis NBRC 13819 = DSM 40847]
MTHRTDEERQRRHALADAAYGHTTARVLPWTTEDAKPCLLLTDTRSGHVSRLADGVESLRLAAAADLLAHAQEILDDPSAPEAELRCAAALLCECLRDALEVAESRGSRLRPPPTTSTPEPAREHTDSGSPAC